MKLTGRMISKIIKSVAVSNTDSIVLIDVMGDKSLMNEDRRVRFSIYRVDKEYNVIWQVKEAGHCKFPDGDPFCYLAKKDDGRIIADRFSGFTYVIDAETGEALRTGFHK